MEDERQVCSCLDRFRVGFLRRGVTLASLRELGKQSVDKEVLMRCVRKGKSEATNWRRGEGIKLRTLYLYYNYELSSNNSKFRWSQHALANLINCGCGHLALQTSQMHRTACVQVRKCWYLDTIVTSWNKREVKMATYQPLIKKEMYWHRYSQAGVLVCWEPEVLLVWQKITLSFVPESVTSFFGLSNA